MLGVRDLAGVGRRARGKKGERAKGQEGKRGKGAKVKGCIAGVENLQPLQLAFIVFPLAFLPSSPLALFPYFPFS
jgi:hypothetical protein